MNDLFATKAAKPQWQIVYEYISQRQIGDTVTKDQLCALIPGSTIETIRTAFYRAVREIEDQHQRTFACVRGVGYRMVEAVEHEGLAREKHKRAKRQLGAAGRKIRSADRSRLTPTERRRFDAMQDHIGRQQEMIRRLDARVERAEAGIREVRRDHKQDTAGVVDRLDRLTELLERHGISESPASTPLQAA